jgi:uncharacterized damage-inducible protein DinB
MPLTMFTALLDHLSWADAQAVTALRALPEGSEERAQATRLYAHLAGAAHIWHARLEGRAPEHPVWPELALDDATALAATSIAGLRAIASEGDRTFAREVEYRTTSGQPFTNTVADILAHVALHGSYHRGQVALLVRQGGGTPAMTDYIMYVRTDAARR